MTIATSASQSTESSSAFLNSPLLLLEKVTCLAVALSIFLICIFSLAMIISALQHIHTHFVPERERKSHTHKTGDQENQNSDKDFSREHGINQHTNEGVSYKWKY